LLQNITNDYQATWHYIQEDLSSKLLYFTFSIFPWAGHMKLRNAVMYKLGSDMIFYKTVFIDDECKTLFAVFQEF
jgi:hypothetical protein